jgi:hypothetical protein
VTTNLGPNLSFSLPTPIPSTPLRNIATENAPEIIALVQPNSVNNGLKKTPKETVVPLDTAIISKATETTI